MENTRSFCLALLLVGCAGAARSNSPATVSRNTSSTTSSRMVFAAPVRNLAADTKVYRSSRLLQLNVSWQLPSEGRPPTNLILHVLPSNNSWCPLDASYCGDGFVYELIYDMTQTSIMVPKNPTRSTFRILPECCYSVEMQSSPHDGKTSAEICIQVPECVGQVCSCRNSVIHAPNITSVTPIDDGGVKVTWVPQYPEDVSPDTTKFMVRLGEEAIRSNANLTVFNSSMWKSVQAEGWRQYDVHLEAALKPDREYKIQVYGENKRFCSGRVAEYVFHGGSFTRRPSRRKRTISVVPMVAVGGAVFAGACLLAVLTRARWRACLDAKMRRSHRSPEAYTAISANSDSNRFSDVVMSALQQRNILYVEAEIEDARARGLVDGYEISQDRLKFVKEVGKGAFGCVFMAHVEALAGVPGLLTVAVKKLKSQANEDETDEFLSEIAMMKRVGRHPNVVTMLACCTLAQPYCMVMEFVPCGDLLRYLHKLRNEYRRRTTAVPKYLELHLSSSDSGRSYIFPEEKTSHSSVSVFTASANGSARSSLPISQRSLLSSTSDTSGAAFPVLGGSHVDYVLDSRELQNFALQVARGMEYLEHKQITHRDLAARNVLIDEQKTLKISDFGLSRSGIYVNMKHKKVPLRWLSVEAIQDNLYSSKSDVWAFAVLLWEIGTLGAFPYATIGDYRLLPYLLEGKRLEKPDNCTKELYALMTRCWSERVDERPAFSEIVSSLESMTSRSHVYVDFGCLGKDYAFPPTEDDLKPR